MRLRSKWKQILARAWSVRFLVLAGVFTVAEGVVPLLANDVPHNTFVVLTGVSLAGSFISRFIPQKNLSDD